MNDLSVKIVESLRDQVPGSPSTIAEAESDLDPLAINDGDAALIKNPLVEEAAVKKPCEIKVEICDDNAKETDLIVSQNEGNDKVLTEQTESIKDDVREPSPVTDIVETEAPLALKNEPASIPETPPLLDPLDKLGETVPEPKVQVDTPTPIPEEKEPSLPTEIVKEEDKVQMKDVEMTDVKVEEKIEPKHKPQSMNGDIKDDKAMKRRASEEVETESPLKKLCQEVEKTFPQHDTMINDYIHTATKNNVDEIQRHTEQLLAEIQTLRELAQKKEHEWNNILHLKKVKEEILLRLLRRKQVYSFEKSPEVNGQDPFDYLNQAKNLAIDKSDDISGLSLKQPCSMGPMMQPPGMPVTSHYNPMVAGMPPPYDKPHLSMPKPVFPQAMFPGHMPGFPRDINAMNGQIPTGYGLPMGRQGPTKDVKSIIADYRQRNPEVAPRRGRRMKSILNPNMMNAPRPIAPKVDMSNLSNLSNLNMIFNNLDMNQKAMLERLQQIQGGGLQNGLSFKDVLVQFANMQQNNPGLIPPPNRPMEPLPNRPEHHIRPETRRRPERPHEEVHKPVERMASPSPRLPPPPPYPEISLLPVTNQATSETQQQNSLLHGILTKQGSCATQSFSPTLAKLLTSPERKQGATPLPHFGQAKNCGEITITPVQPTPPPADPPAEKTEEVVQLSPPQDDDESPASEGEASGSPSGSGSGRLVIDEGGAAEGAEGAEPADADGDTPMCQGCRRRDAQFVCAGCANQWYCSRECQVAAWDDHSEMCSG